MTLTEALVELYRKAAVELPADVTAFLLSARERAPGDSRARHILDAIVANIDLARSSNKPICQDTGVPIFFVKAQLETSYPAFRAASIEATRLATRQVPLRPNAVSPLSGTNSGDNTGVGVPTIYFEQRPDDHDEIRLMLKGGGSENVGASFSLPDARLKAQRDADGVRRCVLDALHRAQGKGCPPYVIGVGLGGTKDAAARLAKEQLLRPLDDSAEDSALRQLEETILQQANELAIGPLGVGGAPTVMSVKIGCFHRHPATFLVEVAMMCWACRRWTLLYKDGNARYV